MTERDASPIRPMIDRWFLVGGAMIQVQFWDGYDDENCEPQFYIATLTDEHGSRSISPFTIANELLDAALAADLQDQQSGTSEHLRPIVEDLWRIIQRT